MHQMGKVKVYTPTNLVECGPVPLTIDSRYSRYNSYGGDRLRSSFNQYFTFNINYPFIMKR